MKTSKIIFSLIALVFIVTANYAQKENLSKKTGLGFHLNQSQQDFGLGLQLTSPYFAAETVAFRLRGNIMWNENISANNVTVWSSYSNITFGVVSIAREINNFMRLYGEGGLVVLFPSSDFSTKNNLTGGYGLFGFEFFMDTKNNYFIEIGGIGTGATADKIVSKPIYSNGLLINVGFRHQF